ncbi:MAG: hypothetical protein ACP5FH_09825 [Terracidiphilus sp.]
MGRALLRCFSVMACLLVFCLTACHKEERAVAGAAENAVQAEHNAQAAASEQDREGAAIDRIPLPTKSLYANVKTASAWMNPFLSVGPASFSLRTAINSMDTAAGRHPRPVHFREIQLHPADLAPDLVALPPGAWPYGRVIAVAEAPQAHAKDRLRVRRNVESVIQQLNDLGIVVEEWPTR